MEILRKILAPVIVILFFFIALFVFIKFTGPIPFDITQVTTQKSDNFSVTGEGKVQAKPDSVTVHLGVVVSASTSKLAQDQLNTNVNKVLAAIEALGVLKDNIQTQNYSVNPDYIETRTLPAGEPATDLNKISGYSANTNITVKVGETDLANKIIDAATASGANQIGGVDFQVKDKEVALNQARVIAVADAKKKAETAARIAGFRLGKVINYSEGENGGYPVQMRAMAADSKLDSAPTQVQPGTNEVVVTVSLSYEIR